MNGSRSLNLSGHLLMSPGVSAVLGGGGAAFPNPALQTSVPSSPVEIPAIQVRPGCFLGFSKSERENLNQTDRLLVL